MKKVYKYPFEVADEFTVELPIGSKVLCWNFQHSISCIWALVNPDEKKMSTYHFRLCGTGHEIDDLLGTDHPMEELNQLYIGTVFLNDGGLVLHLFLVGINL